MSTVHAGTRMEGEVPEYLGADAFGVGVGSSLSSGGALEELVSAPSRG
ncbi:hypothetical protein [Nocardiopsis sp. ATB16-24]|nr:hypothetical protein [Nocardiopsis sp. ATB16-24]